MKRELKAILLLLLSILGIFLGINEKRIERVKICSTCSAINCFTVSMKRELKVPITTSRFQFARLRRINEKRIESANPFGGETMTVEADVSMKRELKVQIHEEDLYCRYRVCCINEKRIESHRLISCTSMRIMHKRSINEKRIESVLHAPPAPKAILVQYQ